MQNLDYSESIMAETIKCDDFDLSDWESSCSSDKTQISCLDPNFRTTDISTKDNEIFSDKVENFIQESAFGSQNKYNSPKNLSTFGREETLLHETVETLLNDDFASSEYNKMKKPQTAHSAKKIVCPQRNFKKENGSSFRIGLYGHSMSENVQNTHILSETIDKIRLYSQHGNNQYSMNEKFFHAEGNMRDESSLHQAISTQENTSYDILNNLRLGCPGSQEINIDSQICSESQQNNSIHAISNNRKLIVSGQESSVNQAMKLSRHKSSSVENFNNRCKENTECEGMIFSSQEMFQSQKMLTSSQETFGSQTMLTSSQETFGSQRMLTSSQETVRSQRMLTSSQESCKSQRMLTLSQKSCNSQRRFTSSRESCNCQRMLTSSQESCNSQRMPSWSSESYSSETIFTSKQKHYSSHEMLTSSQENFREIVENETFSLEKTSSKSRENSMQETLDDAKSYKHLDLKRISKIVKTENLSTVFKALTRARYCQRCGKIVKRKRQQRRDLKVMKSAGKKRAILAGAREDDILKHKKNLVARRTILFECAPSTSLAISVT